MTAPCEVTNPSNRAVTSDGVTGLLLGFDLIKSWRRFPVSALAQNYIRRAVYAFLCGVEQKSGFSVKRRTGLEPASRFKIVL
jgi:hypothetical protein